MTEEPSVTTAAESVARGLTGPSLSFDLAAETQALLNSPLWQLGGHTARTLVKHQDFRLVLIVLKGGRRLRRHQTDQRISVQTLSGRVQMNLPDQIADLPAGRVLVLDKGIAHDVVALEDSAFLLSLSGVPADRSGYATEFDALVKEHLNFSRLLGLLEAQMALFHRGEQPDYGLVQDVFFYLTNYPDRFHHPKEDFVFARVAERVPAARVRVEELAGQHRRIAESGARFLARLEATLNGAIMPREAVERPALEYVALYREHMAFEEQELFPLGRTHLTAQDWIDASVATKREDDPLFGDLVEERYRSLHRRIARDAGCGCEPL